MAKQDDGLFLLEVLIDKIVFVKSPCFSDKDFRTCVNIECPSVDPLEICDDDPGACIAKSGGPFVKAFNNGKSCLFSLKEADISKAMSKFPIKITVYKSLPCGCLPTKIIMGEATIDMTKEFVQARKKFLEDPTSVSYQALKDSFRIVGPDGAESGEVVMFLRISCFGKLIITRFQGGGGPPNLGATGGGSAIVDRSCNPQKDFQTKDDPCACGVARLGAGGAGGGMGGPSGGGGFGVCPTTHDTYDSMPCQDPDDPCYCSGPKPQSKQAMACRNTDQYCLHVPKDCCPTGNKVIFQVPTDSCGNGHKQRAHFTFTSDGVGDMARDEPGHLMPTTAEDYPGVVYDFPKQVIKLRIGKYIEMPGRKSKLEYQFITPVISHEKEVPVNDTRTAQCNLPSLPLYEELSEERKQEIRTTGNNTADLHVGNHVIIHVVNRSEHKEIGSQAVSNAGINVILTKKSILSTSKKSSHGSFSSLSTFKSKKLSFFSDTATYDRKKYYRSHENQEPCDVLFGKKETIVYNISLFNNFDRHRTSGTQATASVNKCLQVCSDLQCAPRSTSGYSGYCSTFNTSLAPTDIQKRANQGVRYQDVYFFGRKKVEAKSSKTGMGSAKSSHANLKKSSAKIIGNASIQAKSPSSTAAAQTRAKGSSAGTLTGRAVSIKDEKPCPALAGTKGDMVATVSHIRIGPREPCPVHGKEPCQGPKCIVALSGEEQGPVKVTTMTNPRRGVFELVIRRMTGAPLAKNELLLEWTPPPSRPPPCGPPCPKPCSPPGACRPIKCKMIVCRPSPCKPKGCVKGCKKPCGPMPCRAVPCKKCCKSSCCGKPCRPCKPCPPPPKCRPCPPSPCAAPCSPPCCSSPCSMPCKSSPCLRPCPVSYKKTRKARSQPKMKSRRKRISPCCNRSKTCPVVRCRSMPGPCLACCGTPPCPPRKCCSIAPCKPKCCKSSCSTCCP